MRPIYAYLLAALFAVLCLGALAGRNKLGVTKLVFEIPNGCSGADFDPVKFFVANWVVFYTNVEVKYLDADVDPVFKLYNAAGDLVGQQVVKDWEIKDMDDFLFENGGIRKRSHPRKHEEVQEAASEPTQERQEGENKQDL